MDNKKFNTVYDIIVKYNNHPYILLEGDIENKIINSIKHFALDILYSVYMLDIYFRFIRNVNVLDLIYKDNIFLKNIIVNYINRYKDLEITHDDIYNDDLILIAISDKNILVIPFLYEMSKSLNMDFTELIKLYAQKRRTVINLVEDFQEKDLYRIVKNVYKNTLKICIKRSEIAIILTYFYYLLFYIKSNSEYDGIRLIISKYVKPPLFPFMNVEFNKIDLENYDKVCNDFKLVKNIVKVGLKDLFINQIQEECKNKPNASAINKYVSVFNNFYNFLYTSLQLIEVEDLVVNLYGILGDEYYLTISSLKRFIKVIDKIW